MKRTTPTTKQKQLFNKALSNPLAVVRYGLKESFYEFFKYFWPEISNEELVDNWHIKYLCDEVQKVVTRVGNREKKEYDLIINVPPGTSKTSIVTIMLPVWCWLNWHWMRTIAFSYSSSLSLESAETSRDLLRSPSMKKVFPELEIKQDKDTKSNFKIAKKVQHIKGRAPKLVYGGNRYSTSVGGTVTGFHGHLLIGDDPINPHDSVSKVKMEATNRWLDQTLLLRKVDKDVSVLILVMQRLHQNDPTGHLLAKNKQNIKHICLPGELDNFVRYLKPKSLAPMYQDNLLDPVRLSRTALREIEMDLGQYGYAGQIGQNPTPAGGGMFQVDNISIVQAVPNNIEGNAVRYWDKAGSADTGAYTVGWKMAKMSDGRYIVLDVVRGRWGSNDRERKILQTAEADKLGKQKTEQWFEQEPGSGGKESAEQTIQMLDGHLAYKERPVGDKIHRADPFSVQVNNGNVLFLAGAWNAAAIDELRHFPFSTYKDQVDAGSAAYARLRVKKKKVAII